MSSKKGSSPTLESPEPKELGSKKLGLNKLEDITEEDQEIKLNQIDVEEKRSDFVPEEGKFMNQVNVLQAKSPTTDKQVNYSIQNDHAHVIIEAEDKVCLANGMKSLAARFARAVNRVFNRRGKVLDGRYHVHILKTPREVRNALAYVLLNARKHYVQRYGRTPPPRIDSLSSGVWFDGWRGAVCPIAKYRWETALPTFWLLKKGWRRHHRIRLEEVPGRL